MTRPEVELLLCCARTAMDTASAERTRALLRENIDWSAVLQTAQRHGVIPLLYRSLHSVDSEAVPKAFLEQLRDYFYANAGHNALLTRELLKLLQLLEGHGIPALPFKGPVLAAAVYGNLQLRQFGDLDILVRKPDGQRATALLQAQGYRWWNQRPLTLLPHYRRVNELLSADGHVLVELHCALTSWTFYFPMEPTRLWDRCTQVTLQGTPVRSLAPEDLLLFLCVHGAKHHWQRLAWICDVAELLRTSMVDWGRLLDQAGRLGGRRMLGLGVWLAQRLLGAPLLAGVEHQLYADPAIPALAEEVSVQLFANPGHPLAAWDRPWFYLRLRERWRDRLPYAGYLTYRILTSRLTRRLAAARSTTP